MYFLKKTHGTKKGWCDWFVWATAKLIMEAAANSLKIVCRNKCCRGKRVINKKKKKKQFLLCNWNLQKNKSKIPRATPRLLRDLPICLQTIADIVRNPDIGREIVLHLRGRKV